MFCFWRYFSVLFKGKYVNISSISVLLLLFFFLCCVFVVFGVDVVMLIIHSASVTAFYRAFQL